MPELSSRPSQPRNRRPCRSSQSSQHPARPTQKVKSLANFHPLVGSAGSTYPNGRMGPEHAPWAARQGMKQASTPPHPRRYVRGRLRRRRSLLQAGWARARRHLALVIVLAMVFPMMNLQEYVDQERGNQLKGQQTSHHLGGEPDGQARKYVDGQQRLQQQLVNQYTCRTSLRAITSPMTSTTHHHPDHQEPGRRARGQAPRGAPGQVGSPLQAQYEIGLPQHLRPGKMQGCSFGSCIFHDPELACYSKGKLFKAGVKHYRCACTAASVKVPGSAMFERLFFHRPAACPRRCTAGCPQMQAGRGNLTGHRQTTEDLVDHNPRRDEPPQLQPLPPQLPPTNFGGEPPLIPSPQSQLDAESLHSFHHPHHFPPSPEPTRRSQPPFHPSEGKHGRATDFLPWIRRSTPPLTAEKSKSTHF